MKLKMLSLAAASVVSTFLLPAPTHASQVLQGHVPEVIARLHLQPTSRLAATNRLHLAIGLPLRNRETLTNLLEQLYDPTSTNYHRYLTPPQFTQMFSPTEQDYQDVVNLAKTAGLEVVTTYENRVLVYVSGRVSDIEKAFHVVLHTYQHPTESRTFYAPNADPTVDTSVPILEIAGLNNYARPRPMAHIRSSGTAGSAGGSGSSGSYIGKDFRNAYVPSVTLDGSGQSVGLVEFDGYYGIDITNYENLAGLPHVPLQNVPLPGFAGPSSDSDNVGEVSLDIEMVVSMATNLLSVVVFEAPSISAAEWSTILGTMVSSNQIKQFSASWVLSGTNPTGDQLLQQMTLQGQSFFQASGDGDAWVGQVAWPCDNPWVTSVGGTELTMNGSGASYASEAVWNLHSKGVDNGWCCNPNPVANTYWGSGGGTSTTYLIPAWQATTWMTANGGSTKVRNFPDVAMVADNVWVVWNNGTTETWYGTSIAAPLWAAFTALVNQKAAGAGLSPVGFLNPAIYIIGNGANYASSFHDITSGDNSWSGSPTSFYAMGRYDLCTGWGTPKGQNLINALVETARFNPAPPSINTQPLSETTDLGSSASFYVMATGYTPLSIQWFKDGSPVTNGGRNQVVYGANVSGIDDSTLTISNVMPIDAGNYYVMVTNFAGSVTSSNATLILAATTQVTVPGTADITLAGQLSGTALNSGCGSDSAPTNAPADTGLLLRTGEAIQVTSVSGSVTPHAYHYPTLSADGWTNQPMQTTAAAFGLSSVKGPDGALVGLFLGAGVTNNPAVTIPSLDFSGAARDIVVVQPVLQQPFFIGTGRTSAGLSKSYIVPAGGTRLQLGVLDSAGCNSGNSNSYSVTVTVTNAPPNPLPGQVTVPGVADITLAGQPDGTPFTPNYGNDSALLDAPVDTLLSFSAGQAIQFTSVTGSVTPHAYAYATLSADGWASYIQTTGAGLGLSGVKGPDGALVGVFLGAGVTNNPLVTVPNLDFSGAARDIVVVQPVLQQPFFIGTGHTSSNITKSYIAPAGATRLLLGVLDYAGWNFGNAGSYTVDAIVSNAPPNPLPGQVTVPGVADITLAGQPDGTPFTPNYGNDSALLDAPVDTLLSFSAGQAIQFTSVTGSVTPYGYPHPTLDADGWASYSQTTGAWFGLSGVKGPDGALVGVFLGAGVTNNPLVTVPNLDFSGAARDIVVVQPVLQQPFFIGAGHTSSNITKSYIAPAGATRLLLGVLDYAGWNFGNAGSYTVDAIVSNAPPNPLPGQVTVPGVADITLAGQPDGTPFTPNYGNDSALLDAPVDTLLSFSAGQAIQFTSVTGSVTPHAYAYATPSADGWTNQPMQTSGAGFGLSSVTGPDGALVGVFLGLSPPNPTSRPTNLDFSAGAARDNVTLWPLLQQPFFIGIGRTSGGLAKSYIAPAEAARLMLGVLDYAGWNSCNSGSYTVNAVVRGQVQGPPIFGLLSSNAEFSFSFETVAGQVYTIQESSDLRSAIWISVLSFEGQGGPVTIIDPNAGSLRQRFYRVKLGE